MTNPNAQPLFLSGVMPDKCYKNAQEFADELVKILGFPLDTSSVIKGAKGDPGAPGPKGDPGAQGDIGPGASNTLSTYNLTQGSTYVDIDLFLGWEKAGFKIKVDATVGGPGNWNPATGGIVGVGSIIPVYADPILKLRVFFLFGGGITAVPATNHVLCVNIVQ